MQKSEYDELLRNKQNNRTKQHYASTPDFYDNNRHHHQHNTSSSTPMLPNEMNDMRNMEGKTFKQKVDEVLSIDEKAYLKRLLLDYNSYK